MNNHNQSMFSVTKINHNQSIHRIFFTFFKAWVTTVNNCSCYLFAWICTIYKTCVTQLEAYTIYTSIEHTHKLLIYNNKENNSSKA